MVCGSQLLERKESSNLLRVEDSAKEKTNNVRAKPFSCPLNIIIIVTINKCHSDDSNHLPKRCFVTLYRFNAASSLPLVITPSCPMSYISELRALHEGYPASEGIPPKIMMMSGSIVATGPAVLEIACFNDMGA